jgi:hypothetical protein
MKTQKQTHTQHTPGPWCAGIFGETVIHPETGDIIARPGENFSIISPSDELRANAALIASAPDLLMAMKELFKQCAMIHRYGGETCNQKEADAAIKAGLAAIAKAEGGEG